MAETKLKVRDLKISFKTANGKVQAVRDINFDLYKGETSWKLIRKSVTES